MFEIHNNEDSTDSRPSSEGQATSTQPEHDAGEPLEQHTVDAATIQWLRGNKIASYIFS
mgnify:CR=1 FL=1